MIGKRFLNWSKPVPLLLLVLLLRNGCAQQKMAITFDDLPAHGQLPATQTRLQVAQSILATLKREKLPPTYGFVNGVRTEENPGTMAVLKAWRSGGQFLGNHTWSHPDLEGTDIAEFIAEIQANQPLLRALMKKDDWRWFRYPFLHEGETLEKHRAIRSWLVAHQYKVAEVTMDFEDYLWNDPYARCLDKGDTAAIKELHDSYLATASQYLQLFQTVAKSLYHRGISQVLLLHLGAFDAQMLPELLNMYRSHGFTFVSLAEAQKDAIYDEDPDFAYPGGGPLTEQFAFKRDVPFPANSKPYKRLDEICR